MLVSTLQDLEAVVARCQAAPVVAIDTEFIRERTYFPRLCLVQLGIEGEQFALDPLALPSLEPLAPLLTNPRVVKVFHACSQDLEILYHELGVLPRPLFDTQVAAGFLGYAQQLGYGALVAAECGVKLPKSESLSDWARRPLSPVQLKYALDDVRYLPRIYQQLYAQLVERDRLTWVLPEMDALLDAEKYQSDPERAYTHVKRANTLTRKQLAVLREAAAWRERRAAKANVPRKWIISDEVLIELAHRTPTTLEALTRTRGTESLSEEQARALLRALAKGAACAPANYPAKNGRSKHGQETESVLDLMSSVVRTVSEAQAVAPTLLATRDDLSDLFKAKPQARLLQGWRYELVGKQLQLLLAGEAGITVKNGRIEFL